MEPPILSHIKIKEWAKEDRPREKLLRLGIASLSDAELIAILLGSGSKNESVINLSQRILHHYENDLNKLGKASIPELIKFKGIGEAKAISIAAALELGKRRQISPIQKKQKINSSQDAFQLYQPRLCDLPHEEFWVIILNRSNGIVKEIRISQGGISGTVTDIRIIVRHALEQSASNIILCHNHPSGNRMPSEADKKVTKKIKDALAYFEIQLLDHLIVTESSYYSFADEGIL